ncbi:MAG: tetratricopeptide repeat protein [Candidatus Sulfobium sp.]
MALKEIEKLKEKVGKDPNSKLFVPLAEEYRKEGMLDEAVEVLLSGIERQPGYMSARVSLGKIYLEKGMRDEARSEFENVIKSIPDNLYAHKKLAEIYRDTGEKELAVKAYRTILKLNSMDEEALASLRDLETGDSAEEAGGQAGGREVPEEDLLEGHIHEVPPEEEPPVDSPLGDVDSEPFEAAPVEDLNAFKKSLFGGGDAGDNIPEEIIAEDLPEGETPPDLVDFAGEDVAGGLPEGMPVEDETPGMEEIFPGEETFPERIPEEEDDAYAGAGKAESAGAKVEDFGEVFADSVEAADRKVSEGDYGEAIRIYRKVLSDNPGNGRVLQRLEELRSLLRILGKDKEDLIARLNGFLDGIQKRHNEFLGRT